MQKPELGRRVDRLSRRVKLQPLQFQFRRLLFIYSDYGGTYASRCADVRTEIHPALAEQAEQTFVCKTKGTPTGLGAVTSSPKLLWILPPPHRMLGRQYLILKRKSYRCQEVQYRKCKFGKHDPLVITPVCRLP